MPLLSSLCKLEIKLDTAGPSPLPDCGIDAMLKLKHCCPYLEALVDPEDREWLYIPSTEIEGGFLPKLVSRYVEKPLGHSIDLPPPKWDA